MKYSLHIIITSLALIQLRQIIAVRQSNSIFTNMHTLSQYSAMLPEKPTPDSTDWEHATYKNFFYKRSHPSIWTTLKLRFSLRNFELHIFEQIGKTLNTQLQTLIKERQKRERMGNYVRLIKPEQDAHYIIITNLNGAFHSLVRFLDYYLKEGIIDETFHLRKNYFMIFNGNTITDSPYGLDTLSLMVQLKLTNPDQVFFVRGDQEEKEIWQTTNLSLEIEERVSTPQDTKTLISNLFDTMAEALYIVKNVTSTSVDLVRISNFALYNRSFEENNYSAIFVDPKRQIIRLDEQPRKQSTFKTHVKAIIRGSANPASADKGLVIEDTQGETLIWQAQSGSTGRLQAQYRFFNESFIILKTPASLMDWSLKLFSHDVREESTLEPIARYNFITGATMFDRQIQKNKIKKYHEKKDKLERTLKETVEKEELLTQELNEKKKQYNEVNYTDLFSKLNT